MMGGDLFNKGDALRDERKKKHATHQIKLIILMISSFFYHLRPSFSLLPYCSFR